MVSMEYRGGEFLFNVFMPVAPDYGLEDFYQEVDVETLEAVSENMRPGEIILRVPKFKIEKYIALEAIPQEMGVVRAFDRKAADFSRMVDLDVLELFKCFYESGVP